MPITKHVDEAEQGKHQPLLLSDTYHQIFDVIPHTMFLINLQGKIQYSNTAASQLLGYTPEQFYHMSMGRLIPGCADDLYALLAHDCSSKSLSFSMKKTNDLKILCQDNSSRCIELNLSSLEATDGYFVLASVVDLHEHRLTELELSRSNRELNQFAYVASHDLKAPLRGIDNLATWIWEDIDDKELVADHVQMMRCRLQRMRTLLDDLLEYSRIGKMESNIADVDINYMAQDLFQQSSPPSTFRLDLGEPLAPFKALAAPLAQVIRNLINNAIKHHHKEGGVVKVRASDKGMFVEIVVEDDGPGIEAQYHQQIFGMFEKLRSKDEVEGNGMGLAMVKKITESLGGSISLTSEVNVGSTFCVKWPKQKDDRH